MAATATEMLIQQCKYNGELKIRSKSKNKK